VGIDTNHPENMMKVDKLCQKDEEKGKINHILNN